MLYKCSADPRGKRCLFVPQSEGSDDDNSNHDDPPEEGGEEGLRSLIPGWTAKVCDPFFNIQVEPAEAGGVNRILKQMSQLLQDSKKKLLDGTRLRGDWIDICE